MLDNATTAHFTLKNVGQHALNLVLRRLVELQLVCLLVAQHFRREEFVEERLRLLGLVTEGENERRQLVLDLHVRMQRLVKIANEGGSIWSVHAQALGKLVEDDELAFMPWILYPRNFKFKFVPRLLRCLGLFLLKRRRFSGRLAEARSNDGLFVNTSGR